MTGEAIVVPLSPDDGAGSAVVAVALEAGQAAADASGALDTAQEAQAEATAAIAEGAAVAARVDLIGNDLLALSQRISTVEGMVGELTGTLLDAINAAMEDEEAAAADAEPDIVPVVDEAPAADLPPEGEPEAEPEPEEPVKEEKQHAAPKRRKYGFRK